MILYTEREKAKTKERAFFVFCLSFPAQDY